MRINFLLATAICLVLSGCGDIEWFPENPAFTNNSSNTTTSSLRLTKAYSPAAILADKTSTLTFTITNATGNPAQTGLGFVDQLDTNLILTKGTSTCGADFSILNSQAILAGGQLAAGTPSCTMTVIVGVPDPGIEGSFINKSSDVSSLQGGLVNGVTDQTLKVFPSLVADSTGTLVASNLVATVTNENVRTYEIKADVENTNDTAITAVVTAIPVDADGNQVSSAGSLISNDIFGEVGALTSTTLAPISVNVPVADAAKIKFWRISSVDTL